MSKPRIIGELAIVAYKAVRYFNITFYKIDELTKQLARSTQSRSTQMQLLANKRLSSSLFFFMYNRLSVNKTPLSYFAWAKM